YETQIMDLGRRAKVAHDLLLHSFSMPAFRVSDASRYLKVSNTAANTLVGEMARIGIIKEVTGFSRNRIFVLHEYLKLFTR
ncbi:MAG: Fic family protein, partial [Actinomycetota bacterium]